MTAKKFSKFTKDLNVNLDCVEKINMYSALVIIPQKNRANRIY